MEKAKKTLTILNLAGELIPELMEYFISRRIELITPLSIRGSESWTHIITKDTNDFDQLNEKFHLIKNNCHLISLSKIEDLRSFTFNNGNLVLDEIWFKGAMGFFIFDKYFQDYGGISLGDNYPSFRECGSFNVSNPFNTGEYLDQMVHKAFECGIEALAVKTYFDHLVMFAAGLKKKGKAGLPFEITYGTFENIFALQFHFFSQELEILDITTSLSSIISKRAEEYYLNIAVQSADFFDFTFMPEVNKVVITGLWNQDERINSDSHGCMFKSLDRGARLSQYQIQEPTSALFSSNILADLTDKISVSDNTPLEGELILSKIMGDSNIEELVQTIKGNFKEDETSTHINGSKLDVDKTVYKIASSVDKTLKESKLNINYLSDNLPHNIKSELFNFAKISKKDVEDLDENDLNQFQNLKMAEILKAGLIDHSSQSTSHDDGSLAFKKLESLLSIEKSDHNRLKIQMKALSTEVSLLKQAREKLAQIQKNASEAILQEIKDPAKDPDEVLRMHFQKRLKETENLDQMEVKKLSALLERESKLIADAKQEELKARKIQIEAIQKENVFMMELEKANSQVKTKDGILIKTKETFTRLMENKDKQLLDLSSKADQLSKALVSGPNSNHNAMLKDMERQNQNLKKQIEYYKTKALSLGSNIKTNNVEDDSKEVVRRLQIANQQLVNQLDSFKKEFEKLKKRFTADSSQLLVLRQEKMMLELQLKKTTFESKKETESLKNQNGDQEFKRLQIQNQILESQVKDSSQKIHHLEVKLAEFLKPQKVVASDDLSKVKVTQLENALRKLTQDLIESRNLLADSKKETNKIRQDKTALQNLFDKVKKDADRAKAELSKKPSGKAA